MRSVRYLLTSTGICTRSHGATSESLARSGSSSLMAALVAASIAHLTSSEASASAAADREWIVLKPLAKLMDTFQPCIFLEGFTKRLWPFVTCMASMEPSCTQPRELSPLCLQELFSSSSDHHTNRKHWQMNRRTSSDVHVVSIESTLQMHTSLSCDE